MHEEIKKFSIHGEVDYARLTQARKTLEEFIEDQMRHSGYVPVLDMEPQLTQSMEGGRFSIEMSIYGAYIGKDEVWDTAGMMGGKKIMKYIPKTKSSPSLPTLT